MPPAKNKNAEVIEQVDNAVERPNALPLLTSKQEVADALHLSIYQLSKLLQRYPFSKSGVMGKINGRWKVARDDVWRWFRFVQRQEMRHPNSRRMRPEEPPELECIRGR